MDQQTIADYPVGGAATTPTFRYVYASYIDEPVVRKGPTSTSTVHFYHRNHQYSVTAMTTSTGAIAERYAYTAYGQPTILNASGTPLSPQTSTLNSRYSYTGREWDVTLGLHHFRARWLSPNAGRFLTRDPIGYADGELLYACKISLNSVDFDGLDKKPTTLVVKAANPRNLDPKCNNPSASARFSFVLEGPWPCRSGKGYFVQEVRAHCHVSSCDNFDGGTLDHFTYFEAWPVLKNGRKNVIDQAAFSSSGRGRYRQDGTVKFYCVAPDNNPIAGEISQDEANGRGDPWHTPVDPDGNGIPNNPIFYGKGPCGTTPFGLHSRATEPAFWSRAAAAGPGHRNFIMNWNCCCPESFANATARP
ncbi:MAG: RHS repeat domain-containing protein [Planctomycetota bacterium]